MTIPTLETDRLIVRAFTFDDIDAAFRAFDVDMAEGDTIDAGAFGARRAWLDWTVRSYAALDRLYQPPYGDRAVIHKTSSALIGTVGLVPALGPFGQLPSAPEPSRLFTPEVGLYWALTPSYRHAGYATEAARALVDWAFANLHLRRIVATTTDDNLASQAVCARLGMRIERNLEPEPPWFQIVGILEHP